MQKSIILKSTGTYSQYKHRTLQEGHVAIVRNQISAAKDLYGKRILINLKIYSQRIRLPTKILTQRIHWYKAFIEITAECVLGRGSLAVGYFATRTWNVGSHVGRFPYLGRSHVAWRGLFECIISFLLSPLHITGDYVA